jgi:hypothetical protein
LDSEPSSGHGVADDSKWLDSETQLEPQVLAGYSTNLVLGKYCENLEMNSISLYLCSQLGRSGQVEPTGNAHKDCWPGVTHKRTPVTHSKANL